MSRGRWTASARGGWLAAGVLALLAGSPSMAQLRVVCWNISAYGGASAVRDPAFQTALFAEFQGRSARPDVFLGQEFTSVGGLNAFLALMNAAAGPGTFAAAPFVSGPDSVSVLIYRTSKVQFLGATVVSAGGPSPNPPRNTMRFDIRPVGYSGAGATMAIYNVHFKAGTTGDDQQRRQLEAQRIRSNAELLPTGWQFMVAGDLNVTGSADLGFQTLVASTLNNAGRVFDPIRTPGVGAGGLWNNQSSMRFVHTQAPGDSPQGGGMDDRFDFILLSAGLLDGITGQGLEYIGNSGIPYSTTTWNDPNHSYRVWGNDGSFFDQPITATASTNAMVGAVIAGALNTSASTDTFGGHLPVLLDLRVPPRLEATPSVLIDFGTVAVGSTASRSVVVRNSGDVALWTAGGIGTLRYSLATTAGFSAPAGLFLNSAGATGNQHVLGMDTSTPGLRTGVLTIGSNAPGAESFTIELVGEVVEPLCYANCDASTGTPSLTPADFVCFLNKYRAGDGYANCDGSTGTPSLTPADFVCFLNKYRAGC